MTNHDLADSALHGPWVSLRLFIEINGWTWEPKPDIDDVEAAVVAIAAGEWDEPAADSGRMTADRGC